MTCLVGRSVSGTWMKLCSSMLGAFFVYTLKLSMPIFKKKISARRFLEKMAKLFICNNNVTTMKSLAIFSRNLRRDFFLKIGILSVKVYTKKVPKIEECNFIHVPLRLLTPKQIIVVLYLQGVQLYETVCRPCILYRKRGQLARKNINSTYFQNYL